MSSIKLNSSGGGSVSLSAASTSTDVTIKFPSGNSSAGQALVAGNTSGELDWETVPNSTAVPLLRLTNYNITNTSDYVGSSPARALEWTIGSSNNNYDYWETDTHSAWDATNYWYVAPQAGFYRVTHSFNGPIVSYADTTKVHHIHSVIVHAPAANKGTWSTNLNLNTFNSRDGDASFSSYAHTEIVECAAGDAIKTSFAWDKGTDTNNTTTSVQPGARINGSIFAGQSLYIEFLRPL
jgi:hypothetical protein